MSDDRAGFLAAIRESPEDDTPRLVFADWLDEQGDEARAEFIRAQITTARLDDLDPERIRLDRRSTELLRQNEKTWLAPVRRVGKPGIMERGFPRNVEINSRKFREKGAELTAIEPIWSVCPTALRADAANLSDLMAALAGVRELTLKGLRGMSRTLRIDEWSKIFTSPALGSVHSLALEDNALPVASHKTLFETPYLGNVRRLVLGQNATGGTRHLVGATNPPVLASLREMHFHLGTNLKGQDFAPWAERLPWSQITHLTLPRWTLGPVPSFPTAHLRSFRAVGFLFEDDRMEPFLAATTWPELQRLEFTHRIESPALSALSDPHVFPQLRSLAFCPERAYASSREKDAPAAFRAWARSPVVGQLEELVIDWEGTDYAAVFLDALSARPTPVRLRKLVLRKAALPAETLAALMSSGVFPELQGIMFDCCDFPDNRVELLVASTLPQLRGIGLQGLATRGNLGALVERFGADGIRTDF